MSKTVRPTASTSLKISAAPQKQLSKTQTQFNQHIRRIEKLQKEIPLEVEKYDVLLHCSNQYVIPALEKIARARIQIAVHLDAVGLSLGFKKKQMNELGWCIEDLLREAFSTVDPTEAEAALYKRWAGTSFEEAEAERVAGERSMMENMFEAMFGVRVDLEAMQNDPSVMDDYQRQIEEREKAEAERFAGNQKKRQSKAGKSKKEEIAKAQEELKSKSLRSIYISLAKLVHPDMESDPSLRAAKEEEMKKVTAAYEANDLATLLKMEMEWIHKHNDELDRIPEDKLKLFVEVLRDQVKELEAEKHAIAYNPKYGNVAQFGYGRIEIGLQKIKKEASVFQKMAKQMESIRRSLQVPDPKKVIQAFVKDYLAQIEEEDDFGFFY